VLPVRLSKIGSRQAGIGRDKIGDCFMLGFMTGFKNGRSIGGVLLKLSDAMLRGQPQNSRLRKQIQSKCV
jgi:hypothetical protein